MLSSALVVDPRGVVFSDAPICRTCAVQYPPGDAPASCLICEDERQYVGFGGQEWTTLHDLNEEGHTTEIRELEDGLHGVGVGPSMGIGQRSLIVRTDAGNVLWDPTGFIDRSAVRTVEELGGLDGIAASHPHFYGVMVEWSHAFGGAPLYLPEADREWVVRDDTEIVWWGDELEVIPGVRLVRCGGHFEGSAVLHWQEGADGRGAVLVGDTATVVPDRRYVSFMRSYPNHIPLPTSEVDRIVDRMTRYPFDRIYGAWWPRVIERDGMAAVERSADRYRRWSGPGLWIRRRPPRTNR